MVGDAEGRSLRSRDSIVAVVGRHRQVLEESHGHPFALWKDHFGCAQVDQWWGQAGAQKTKDRIALIVAIQMRNNTNLE